MFETVVITIFSLKMINYTSSNPTFIFGLIVRSNHVSLNDYKILLHFYISLTVETSNISRLNKSTRQIYNSIRISECFYTSKMQKCGYFTTSFTNEKSILRVYGCVLYTQIRNSLSIIERLCANVLGTG